jgi:zinc/manganese transport system substrate-binding protein
MRAAMLGILAALAFHLFSAAAAGQGPVSIVAAENFYGNVAQAIGGAQVRVASILSNPNQDPHLFEADVSTARQVSGADIVIENGAAYDPWMDRLLAASPNPSRSVIVAATLVGRKDGDNPHIWYDPATMPAVAKALAAELTRRDPGNAELYRDRLSAFLLSLQPLQEKIATLTREYGGAPVTATEPVFGYMAEALGLEMRNARFQLAIMNDTEPSASAMAAFEKDLRQREVKVLFYNSQVTDDTTRRFLNMARESGVPVVGVTETMPADANYLSWMVSQLDALQGALEKEARRVGGK